MFCWSAGLGLAPDGEQTRMGRELSIETHRSTAWCLFPRLHASERNNADVLLVDTERAAVRRNAEFEICSGLTARCIHQYHPSVEPCPLLSSRPARYRCAGLVSSPPGGARMVRDRTHLRLHICVPDSHIWITLHNPQSYNVTVDDSKLDYYSSL